MWLYQIRLTLRIGSSWLLLVLLDVSPHPRGDSFLALLPWNVSGRASKDRGHSLQQDSILPLDFIASLCKK